STPLSSRFAPSRQLWKRRLATSSRLSPSSEGKIAIGICVPVACSYSASFASSRPRASAARSPALSFTRALGAGGRTRATARRAASRLELHLGRGGRVGRGLEEGLRRVARHRRDHGAGEEAQARVVVPYRLVEPPPLHRDPVLRALELGLQREEVRIRLEVGVALDR